VANLPQVGLEAVIENLAAFEKGARTIEEAFAYVSKAEAKIAKESPEAAAALEELRKEFIDSGGDIRDWANAVESGLGEVTNAWEDMARLMSLGALQQVAGAMGQVGDQIIDLAKDSVMTAARIEELDLVLGNLAEQSGLSAAAMEEQVQAIRDQGIQADVAYNLVSQFVRANLDLSKASELARLAQDAAVISMEDSSQALSGLLHGVLTLQPELLRYRGIIVDFQSEYKRWADANNRTVLSLTSVEKQQIALEAALEQGSAIAGTYESAMESASKQLRSMPRYIADLKAELGDALLPVYSDAVFATKDLIKEISALPAPIKSVIAATGTMAGGLLKGTSALVSFGAQAAQISIAVKELGLATKAASLAFLGPLGLVAGLVAVAGVGIASYLKEQERAHQEEATAILNSTTKYENYILQVEGAELGSYALSESLYEIARAAEAAGRGLTAAELVEATRELELAFGARTTGIEWWDDFTAAVDRAQFSVGFLKRKLDELLPTASAAQIAILKDVETLERFAEANGYTEEQTEIFIDTILEAVDAQQELRLAVDATTISMGDHEERMLGLTDAVQGATDAEIAYRTAIANSGRILGEGISREDQLAVTRMEGQAALKDYIEAEKERAKAAEQAAKDAEKAEQERVRAQEQALREMEQNEAAYGREISNLYDSIVTATEQALQARQAAEEQYAQDVLALEQELAEQRADIERDLARDLEDDRRKQAQREEDLARDLARDLDDIAAQSAQNQKAIWDEYYASLEALTAQHNQRMEAMAKRHADEIAGIESKYELDPEATYDEQREALQQQLKDLLDQEEDYRKRGLGYEYEQRRRALLEALEQLKQEELAALEERQQAERDAEAAAYEQEKTEAQARRDEQLEAERLAAEERIAQRQQEYARALEDLKISHQRQRDERQRAAQEARDDLAREGQERRAALDAQHREELDSIRSNLNEQLQSFRDSYTQQLWDLDTYLASRMQKWREHQAAVEALLGISSPSRWMVDIGEQLNRGLEVGFGKNPLVDAMGAFKQQTVQAAVSPQAAAAAGTTSVSNTRSYNVNYTGQVQSEEGIRSMLTMMEMASG
jgi:hypothetical protein